MSESPHVIAVGAADFEQQVLQRSHDVPVLVDFWAEWCAPCRQLMPVLAQLAVDYDGKFVLAKVDTEAERDLAARYGIRSLPTVKMFVDGEIADEFSGALPELQIRAFVDRFVAREVDEHILMARTERDNGNPERAIALLSQAADDDDSNFDVVYELVDLLLAQQQVDAAQTRLDALPAVEQLSDRFKVLQARLQLTQWAQDTADTDNDDQRRLQRAASDIVAGAYEDGMTLLLEQMRQNRQYADDAARKLLLATFLLPDIDSALVNRFRGQMSALLY